MKDIKRTIRYKSALMTLGLTQKEVAKILNVTESYISHIVAGNKKCKAFDEWLDQSLKSFMFKDKYARE